MIGVGGGAEHTLLLISAFLFPPIAFLVGVVVLLATLGRSLGLREMYVSTLIKIFEWGARQIKTTARLQRKESQMSVAADTSCVDPIAYSSSDDDGAVLSDDDETASKTAKSDGYESSSGLSARQRNHSGNSSSSQNSATSYRRRRGSGNNIIVRDTTVHLDDDDDLFGGHVKVTNRGWAVIQDSVDFIKNGIESIIEDEVTMRFEAEQLMTWNMLTRTSTRFFKFVNWKLTCLWVAGFLFRYTIMFPLRITLFIVGLIFLLVSTAIVGVFPAGRFKKMLNEQAMLICHRILSRSISAVVYFHDRQHMATSKGIAVANHTSPMDVMLLSTDNVYALIGQSHGGLLGLMQRALSRASNHIWFERSAAKDRSTVAARLCDHVADSENLPILIFPEGTCINNTSVMMFKKGSFEVETTIYPIAMKYDSRFGDPFWNSSEQSWGVYILRMMTSWAIICHVWYLPPMIRQPNEDAVEFASRVKKLIASKGGLVDLEWDGMLKRSKVPPRLVAKQQDRYFNRLSRYTSTSMADMPTVESYPVDEGIVTSPLYNSLEDLPEDVIVSDVDDGAECEDDHDHKD